MRIKLVTPPVVEPIDLSEAIRHLRVSDDSEMLLIDHLIKTARKEAENITNRQFITATWDLILDRFPYPCQNGVIQIPRPPLQSVTSLTYLDGQGTSKTLATSVYKVDVVREPAQITLKYGQEWPEVYLETGVITLRFVAGYGNVASAVPEPIRQWMLIRIASLFEQRETFAAGVSISEMARGFTDGLLDSYRIQWF